MAASLCSSCSNSDPAFHWQPAKSSRGWSRYFIICYPCAGPEEVSGFNADHCSHLRNEPENKQWISLIPLSLFIPDFQINKWLFLKRKNTTFNKDVLSYTAQMRIHQNSNVIKSRPVDFAGSNASSNGVTCYSEQEVQRWLISEHPYTKDEKSRVHKSFSTSFSFIPLNFHNIFFLNLDDFSVIHYYFMSISACYQKDGKVNKQTIMFYVHLCQPLWYFYMPWLALTLGHDLMNCLIQFYACPAGYHFLW